MRKVFSLVVVILACVVAAAVGPRDGVGAIDAGIVDRTLLCTVERAGGIHEITVRANPGFRQGSAWGILAFAAVSTGAEAHSSAILTDSLAWVSAGRYTRDTNLEPSDGVAAANAARLGTSALSRVECTPANARVPLSGRGLRNAAPGPLGASFKCATPRRVLVRVRATASTIVGYRQGGFEKTRTALQSGYLAVRTQAGKQLAFASVSDSGKTRLLTAPSCIED